MLNSDESDLGSDDEDNLEDYLPEDMKTGVSSKKKSKGQAPTKILEDNLGDEVLDFLNSNVVSRVTSGAKSQSKKIASAANGGVRDEFEFNSKGRLIIHDSDEEDKANKKNKGKSNMMETDDNEDGDMYMKSLMSEAAMQRMPNGKMRLVNKRKRDEDDDEPMDLDDVEEEMVDQKQVAAEKRKKAEEKALNQMLGRQFKAKNARGDVKKGDLDPYAYIPLDAKIGGKSRKKAKSQGQFKNIIKAAQRGADVKSSSFGKRGSGIRKANKKHNK